MILWLLLVTFLCLPTQGWALSVSAPISLEDGTIGMVAGANDNTIELYDTDTSAWIPRYLLSTDFTVTGEYVSLSETVNRCGTFCFDECAEVPATVDICDKALDLGGGTVFIPDGGTTSLTCTALTPTQLQVLDNGTLEWCDGAGSTTERSVAPFGPTIDDTELTAENFGAFTCSGSEDGCEINSSIAAAGLALDTSTTPDSIKTASQEAAFFADGGTTSLTCTSAQGAGSAQVMDSGNMQVCSGASTPLLGMIAPNIPMAGWGGTAGAAFTYAGQGTGACSGDICRGGVCSGTTPNGTCTLTPNSEYWKNLVNLINDPSDQAYYARVDSFTVTGGTITISNASIGTNGMVVVFLVRDNVSIDETTSAVTFNLEGRGAAGGCATPAAVDDNAQGGFGGSTAFNLGGWPSLSAGNGNVGNAFNSASPINTPYILWTSGFMPVFPGTGGGCAKMTSGTSGGIGTNLSYGRGLIGSTGGGGPWCPVAASGTVGTAGRGGGGIAFVVGGSYSCVASGTPSNEFDLDGTAGGTGAAGGGGGILTVIARAFGTTTCDIEAEGGAAGASLTDCSSYVGGVGGHGGWWFVNTTTGAFSDNTDDD